jgi:hypothetical protein
MYFIDTDIFNKDSRTDTVQICLTLVSAYNNPTVLYLTDSSGDCMIIPQIQDKVFTYEAKYTQTHTLVLP